MMQIDAITRRARAIRYPQREIASASGLEENTISRVLGGRSDPRHSTLAAIEAAVRFEELRLLRHLIALHGIPDDAAGEAAGMGDAA